MMQKILEGLNKEELADKIKWRQNEKYVFVSYASLDWQKVYPTVICLQNMGFNIYIDTEFKEEANTGWLEKMTKNMANHLCKGIITFVSINSLRSYAVLIEQLFCHSYNVKKNFRYNKIPNFFISLNCNTPQDLKEEIYDALSESSEMKVTMLTNECQNLKTYREDYLRENNKSEYAIKKELDNIKDIENKHDVAVMMYDFFTENKDFNLIEFGDANKCSKLLEKNFVGEKNSSIDFKPNINYVIEMKKSSEIKEIINKNSDDAVKSNYSTANSIALKKMNTNNVKEGKGIRYENKYDEEFSCHSLSELIEKSNRPTGWNGSILEGIKLFGKTYQMTSFSKLVLYALEQLYKKDTSKFKKVSKDSSEYQLDSLFKGIGDGGIKAPNLIPETDIKIESKTNYDTKIKQLRFMFDAMGVAQDELQISLKLAHRMA